MDQINEQWKALAAAGCRINVMGLNTPAIGPSWKEPKTLPQVPPKVSYPDGYTPRGDFAFCLRSVCRTLLFHSGGNYYRQEMVDIFHEIKPEVIR